MKILLIGKAGRLDAEPTRAFLRRGHAVTETGPEGALDRARELSPDVIVLDTGAVADHAAEAPDLGSGEATRAVPVLTVHLDAGIPADRLVALVERIARQGPAGERLSRSPRPREHPRAAAGAAAPFH